MPSPDAGRSRAISALPLPSPDSLDHSARLHRLIRDEIEAAGGAIDFARFMELTLYAPGLGYYSAGARKLGAEGDFVTAPEISPIFARCLAADCAQALQTLGGGDLLEFGAGSGALAADLLAELARLGTLPDHYFILDVSADLRERQRNHLARTQPGLADRVTWLDRLPERFEGVMLANEVLDAMPVHRFHLGGGVDELTVSIDGGRFVWGSRPAQGRLAVRAAQLRERFRLPVGYLSEVSFAAEDWIGAVAAALHRGVVLLIDYGFPDHEYYHPQRTGGTLMCHYRHRAHDDPFLYPGLQDITAHVDFTAVAEAAHSAGLRVAGFTTQAHFLLASGLAEVVGEMPEALTARLALGDQLRKLTSTEEMGELFKVLALTRGFDHPLQAFMLRDDRFRL